MKNNIQFSIIIPLYNKEIYIKQTIESILLQSFKNYEILIIDDGSTDNSCTIVNGINDSRISLIHQTNAGPSKARNRGIKEAKGKYIAFLDADDTWHPEYLKNQNTNFTQTPNVIWSCVGYKKVFGNNIKETYCYPKYGIIKDAIDKILPTPYIWTGAVAINSDIFLDKRFLFNEEISRSEDLELWFKLACKYPKICYTNKVLVNRKVSVDGSLTITETDNEDFSYLSLSQRIDHELNQIVTKRKEKITSILRSFSKKKLLTTWKSTYLFKHHKEKFRQNLDKGLYNSLIYLDFLPILLKKVYIRLLQNFKLFGLNTLNRY